MAVMERLQQYMLHFPINVLFYFFIFAMTIVDVTCGYVNSLLMMT